MTEVDRRLAGIQAGDHLCLMYAEPADALESAAYYLKEGLRRGEICLCLVADLAEKDIVEALEHAGVDSARERDRHHLVISEASSYFAPAGSDVDKLLEQSRKLLDTEFDRGARGVRVVVDMSWVLTSGLSPDALLEYESGLNALLEGMAGSWLCMYSRRRFPARLLRRVLEVHPAAVARELVLPNVYYVPPGLPPGEEGEAERLDWQLEQLWRIRITEEDLWSARTELVARERAAREDVVNARGMAFLAEAGAVLSSSLEYEVTLDRLAKLAVRDLADFALVDILDEKGEVRRLATAHRDPSKEELVQRLMAYPPRLDISDGVPQVLRTGEPALLTRIDAARHRAVAQDLTHLALIRQLAPRSLIVAPLRTRGKTIGALTLASTRREYVRSDLSLAIELASRAALAVENARLYREAQEAVRRRDEVIAIMSHDLRNPVGAIHTVAELLRNAPVPTNDLRKHAGLIANAAKSALVLIEDLLDISRIESGNIAAGEVRPCNIVPVIREVCELFEPYAREKRLKLSWVVDDKVPAVLVDPDRLSQVLANLIGNAIKFTDHGHVVVRVQRAGDQVEVTVEDSGPGFTEEERVHMFDRFWQAVRKQRAGAGLGLAICKGIVEGYGGRIWADTQVGRGSKFHFTIPLASHA